MVLKYKVLLELYEAAQGESSRWKMKLWRGNELGFLPPSSAGGRDVAYIHRPKYIFTPAYN